VSTDTPTDTARDRLDRLASEHAQAVRAAIDGGDRPSPKALRAVLEQAHGRIAYVIQHRSGIEYLTLDGDTLHAHLRRTDGHVLSPVALSNDVALATRACKQFDVIPRENVPAWVGGGA